VRPLEGLTAGRRAGALRAVMVDVGPKSESARTALARAVVRFPAGLLGPLLRRGGPKGPIEEVARLAGIQAAKRTAEWIPLAHPLPLQWVDVRLRRAGPDRLQIECAARTHARTGVEMEALVGAAAAALAVFDMTKALSKAIAIERLELCEKTGGKSGDWYRARRR
jgi:cyclic pyranopterin phosphate synthase